jgi:hypothetical protein
LWVSFEGGIRVAPRKISAKDLVADIKARLSDDDLAGKYGISSEGLQRLFHQLLDKGLITQSDIERRPPQPRNEPTPPPVVEPVPENIPTGDSANPSVEASTQTAAVWYQRKAIVILLLIFFAPIGLYGLYKTSLFSKTSKIIISVIAALLGVASSPLRILWLIGSAGCVTGYLLYKFVPLGKVPRIAIGTVCGLALVGITVPWIDKDFTKRTQRVPVQSIPATQTAAPQAAQPAQPKPAPADQVGASTTASLQDEPSCNDQCVHAHNARAKRMTEEYLKGGTGAPDGSQLQAEFNRCIQKCAEKEAAKPRAGTSTSQSAPVVQPTAAGRNDEPASECKRKRNIYISLGDSPSKTWFVSNLAEKVWTTANDPKEANLDCVIVHFTMQNGYDRNEKPVFL